jgi:hypothetical protein
MSDRNALAKADGPWHRSDEPLPENFYAGDRLAIAVVEREELHAPLKPRIVMLTAREHGWEADDPTFSGYSPSDGEFWAIEKELLGDAALAAYKGREGT